MANAVSQVGFAKFDRMLKNVTDQTVVDGILDRVAAAGAFTVETLAKLEAIYDTGFMRNSIYVVTPLASGFGRAEAAAKSHNPNGVMLPTSAEPRHGEAYVVCGAEYGIHVEYLTQAFMRPAIDDHKPEILNAMTITADREIGSALK